MGRKLQLARGAYGLALLLAPQLVLRVLTGGRQGGRVALVTRVLGARNVAQTLFAGPTASPAALYAGVGVDCLHAASMLGLAAIDRRYRGLALRSATSATSWAIAGLRAAKRD